METFFANASNPAQRALHVLMLLFACGLPSLAAATTADTRAAQRSAFVHAYASASRGDPAWKKQAATLKHYPLYPYLQAAVLRHDLKSVSRTRIENYLARWPKTLSATMLRSSFLHELARRHDWKGFRALYRHGLGTALTCRSLQAKLAAGKQLDFQRDLAALWQHTSLPASCNPVLQWAHQHKLLTRKRLWQRIDRAAAASRSGTVASLTRWLQGDDAVHGKRLTQALRQPAQTAADAMHWPDNPRNRTAATIAMRRLTRHNSKRADAIWPKLRQHLHFSTMQRNRILHDMALFHATDFSADAIRRLRQLPAAAQSDATRGWRLRVALARHDWQGVLDAYAAMPALQQQDNEWSYLHARAMAALGYTNAAHEAYASLARKTTYFGFLAADRLHARYAICPAPAHTPVDEQFLLKNPGLHRAFELFAVHLPKLARREWRYSLRDASSSTRRLSAMLAYQRGWYDRAIFTFNSGSALKRYRQRFPLAHQDRVSTQSDDAGIDPAWTYAIIRAESAWMADVRSGANAYGLMQLLPGTAKHVAKRLQQPYSKATDLFEPKLNIALGTHYLAQMAARYDGAPWLASAAYNAGPRPVDRWLAARGQLAPDLFVATIPFHETREYVARVMAFSVIYDWRLHGRTLPLSQRMPHFGKPYTAPDSHSQRTAVQCSAAPPHAQPTLTPAATVPKPATSGTVSSAKS